MKKMCIKKRRKKKNAFFVLDDVLYTAEVFHPVNKMGMIPSQ